MARSADSELETRFERLFLAYQQPILNYLYRMVGDLSRAEDLAQETFVKAYRALARLPLDANERAWVYRIATNTARDWHRRHKLIQWTPLLNGDTDPFNRDPAGHAVESETVERTLAELPIKYAAPLVLYSVQGLSTKEIAEVLHISQSAVKVRLYRARKLFREAYGGDYR